jgi:hypothetical protein
VELTGNGGIGDGVTCQWWNFKDTAMTAGASCYIDGVVVVVAYSCSCH